MSSSSLPRTALVLAGGLGTRLQPALPRVPKVLAPVAGRPFLHLLLARLARAGLSRVVLCTGHMADQVERAVESGFDGLEVLCVAEPSPLGTAGALRHALSAVDEPRFLALNGDSFCGCELAELGALHARTHARASMVVVRVGDAGRYGAVTLGSGDRVAGFVEKRGTGPGWINAGIYLLDRSLVQALPPGRAISLEREVLPGLVGGELRALRAPGPFVDIGTPESWRQAAGALASVLT